MSEVRACMRAWRYKQYRSPTSTTNRQPTRSPGAISSCVTSGRTACRSAAWSDQCAGPACMHARSMAHGCATTGVCPWSGERLQRSQQAAPGWQAHRMLHPASSPHTLRQTCKKEPATNLRSWAQAHTALKHTASCLAMAGPQQLQQLQQQLLLLVRALQQLQRLPLLHLSCCCRRCAVQPHPPEALLRAHAPLRHLLAPSAEGPFQQLPLPTEALWSLHPLEPSLPCQYLRQDFLQPGLP